VRDVFPPETPEGLVAVPGFAGADNAARKPTIDLSWEPDTEPDLAGYRVYRRELDGTTPEVWRTLGAELVTVPAYRDLSVGSGQRYAYQVTAVSGAGNESGPSAEAVETAPAP
jgi:fibronectin type 3 domain-containing protein